MNPFKFGSVVRGEYFVDREVEIKEIISGVRTGQHTVLISPRRFGKSSLINRVMEEARMKWFQIDLELITDEVDLANYYVKKTLSLSRFEQIKHYLKSLSIQPSIQIQPEKNEISVSFSPEEKNTSAILLDSLQLPEIMAKKMKKRIAIVFDEFQEIRRISAGLERKMRGVFQHHQNVSYVFIGSQESMIREIFQNRKNPFYRFGRQMVLDKIPEDELKAFIISRFSSQKIDAAPIANDILRFTDSHPYYTQQLCHEIYILNEENRLNREIIGQSVNQIITEHHADYSRWWGRLSNTERKIMIGIASGDCKPTSQGFIRRYGIKSSSTSGSAVNRLSNSGILVKRDGEEFRIEDIFWKEWILNNRAR